MRKSKIRLIAYMAIYAALYVVFKYVGNLIPLFKMPQGGSVEIELAVLFLASFQLGPLFGLGTTCIGFILSSMLVSQPYFINVPQFCFDYVLPLAVVGIASVFGKKTTVRQEISIVISMALKYFFHVLSGVLYYAPDGAAAGSKAAWTFSLGYNAGYNIATAIVCMILIPALISRLKKTNMDFVD